MKKFANIFISAALAVSAGSCAFLDQDPTIIRKDDYYSTKEELTGAIAGVYGAMSNEALYGNYYSLMMTNIDDLSYFNRSTTTVPLQMNRHDASSSEIYAAWTQLYAGVRNANALISATVDSQIEGAASINAEARFLRAYYHFLLAQAWGDVPLRSIEAKTYADVQLGATPQYEVLKWAADEMEDCIGKVENSINDQPSRISDYTIHGILSRVYLFMAGASVIFPDGATLSKKDCYGKAMDHADAVISSDLFHLNEDYSAVFKNMISNKYDREYRESMWEVEFQGDRTSADSWSNGRIGDLIGLLSTGSSDYENFKCNYSYAQYNGSLKLWDLYLSADKVVAEKDKLNDKRQDWNMPPYNYAGSEKAAPFGVGGVGVCRASIDKTPYGSISINSETGVVTDKTTTVDPTAAPAVRNCGKYRREVEFEGVMKAKNLYTKINYPLLRYSDVLLMYAEAANEYEGAPSQQAYDALVEVRDRAGISTAAYSTFDAVAFRSIVRNERARELCFESLRRFDLIRWGIYVQEMNEYSTWAADSRWEKDNTSKIASAMGTSVHQRHIYFPIPAVELGVNNKLEQNKLW